MPRNKYRQKEAETYFSYHPLREITELGALGEFRRENSAIECPRCKREVLLFKHRATGWTSFLLCAACFWYVSNYALGELMEHLRAKYNWNPARPIVQYVSDRMATQDARNR